MCRAKYWVNAWTWLSRVRTFQHGNKTFENKKCSPWNRRENFFFFNLPTTSLLSKCLKTFGLGTPFLSFQKLLTNFSIFVRQTHTRTAAAATSLKLTRWLRVYKFDRRSSFGCYVWTCAVRLLGEKWKLLCDTLKTMMSKIYISLGVLKWKRPTTSTAATLWKFS